MIKRVTTISFILLALAILMAHTVIPHHHHKDKICTVRSHCQSEGEAHSHGTAEHKHKHDGNSNSENCPFPCQTCHLICYKENVSLIIIHQNNFLFHNL